MRKVPTPGKTRCEDVAELLSLPLARTVKAIAVMHDGTFVLVVLRGDHSLNEIKTQKVPGLDPFRFATDTEVEQHLGCKPGYIGPVGIAPGITVVADRSVATMADFVCGANDAGFHLTGVNFRRDLPEPALVADIRNVVAGDPSPDGRGTLDIARGIEVGHIFQLRTKYAEVLKATYLDEAGKQQPFEMGCYGIGITRIVGAAIEQNHDERGIAWPEPMAPFQIAIVPVGYHRSAAVREAADRLHDELAAAGAEVLMDDRDERPGVMFADMELIGIPHRVVVGDRGLKDGNIEYQGRRDASATPVVLGEAATFLRSRLWRGS
jgi:prolyl-tRNA synthetase